jgi:hypothetical protein
MEATAQQCKLSMAYNIRGPQILPRNRCGNGKFVSSVARRLDAGRAALAGAEEKTARNVRILQHNATEGDGP